MFFKSKERPIEVIPMAKQQWEVVQELVERVNTMEATIVKLSGRIGGYKHKPPFTEVQEVNPNILKETDTYMILKDGKIVQKAAK